MLEFKAYSKTPRYKNLHVRVTQKLDGTNGLIAIEGKEFKVGSRSTFLPTPEEIAQRELEIKEWKDIGKYGHGVVPRRAIKPDKLHDNHSFSAWAHANKEALIEFLGEGYHYGEWCGKGIQNGEGLKDKRFYLFSPRTRYKLLSVINEDWLNSKGLYFVPELFNDKLSCEVSESLDQLVKQCVYELETKGSDIGDGSVKPEGLIVEIDGKLKFKVIVNESEKDKRG